jgi:F-type H+-transporting ATPase subunit c
MKYSFIILSTITTTMSAFANNINNNNDSMFAIASVLAIAIPAGMGALAQGRASSAALEGIARNPGAYEKIFIPMILAMALIESLVLFGLVISFSILGKIS